MKRVLLVAAIVVLPFAFTTAAFAHPLGNFTVNQYSGLVVERDRVADDYVVDMAEIPAFQTRGTIDTDHNGRVDKSEASRYRTQDCARLAKANALTVNGSSRVLHVVSSSLSFPRGQAGLATMRLSCRLATDKLPSAVRHIAYKSNNFAGRVGWREITVTGEGVVLHGSNVRTTSLSNRLTRYPEDLLTSPLDERQIDVGVRVAGTGSVEAPTRTEALRGVLPRGVDRATRVFTAFVARRDLTTPFALAALALSILLGAIHALGPGHGKTVMAAYLLGVRGSFRQASLIGLAVTVSHTGGVLALGLVLSTSTTIAPERLYPWFGLASGLMFAAVGVSLVVRALRSRRHLAHHDHPHEHTHATDVSLRGLLAMGFGGGLVPSPSALVVLLGAIALGRFWFGVVLVVAYGLGMAATLTGAGLLLERARGSLAPRTLGSGRVATIVRSLPLAAASTVVVVGVTLAVQAATKLRF